MEILKFIGLCIAAYLFGATPYAYIFPKLIKGVDVRKDGTGNVGISNAFMVGGSVAGTLTFIFDHLKVVFALLFAYYVGGWTFTDNLWNMLILTIFAKLGHDFPVFLKFKGGKGLCIAYGSILFFGPLYWLIGNFTLVIFLFLKNKNAKFRVANIQVLFLMLFAGLMWFLEYQYGWGTTWLGWRFTNLFPEGYLTSTIPLAVMSIVWTVTYMIRRCLFTGVVTDIKAGISPFRAIYLRALFEMYPRESSVRNPGKDIKMGEDDYK